MIEIGYIKRRPNYTSYFADHDPDIQLLWELLTCKFDTIKLIGGCKLFNTIPEAIIYCDACNITLLDGEETFNTLTGDRFTVNYSAHPRAPATESQIKKWLKLQPKDSHYLFDRKRYV